MAALSRSYRICVPDSFLSLMSLQRLVLKLGHFYGHSCMMWVMLVGFGRVDTQPPPKWEYSYVTITDSTLKNQSLSLWTAHCQEDRKYINTNAQQGMMQRTFLFLSMGSCIPLLKNAPDWGFSNAYNLFHNYNSLLILGSTVYIMNISHVCKLKKGVMNGVESTVMMTGDIHSTSGPFNIQISSLAIDSFLEFLYFLWFFVWSAIICWLDRSLLKRSCSYGLLTLYQALYFK